MLPLVVWDGVYYARLCERCSWNVKYVTCVLARKTEAFYVIRRRICEKRCVLCKGMHIIIIIMIIIKMRASACFGNCGVISNGAETRKMSCFDMYRMSDNGYLRACVCVCVCA